MQSLIIDGSHGEGGGQILRTSVALSAVTGRPIVIKNIRKNRPNPGIRAGHLTTVRAVASVCQARVAGDFIGSNELGFEPQSMPRGGEYVFDIGAARMGGSAGAVSLVIQTLAIPLFFAQGERGSVSFVRILGGTHVSSSPPYPYLRDVWLWALQKMGFDIQIELIRTGWYPGGQGEVCFAISGKGRQGILSPISCTNRGKLKRIWGCALVANLAPHISYRMAQTATSELLQLGRLMPGGEDIKIISEDTHAVTAGAGIFLTAEYDHVRAGFGAIGVRGKPAEKVADEAVHALLEHHRSQRALDVHLGDQLILPAALAGGPSAFSVERITSHILAQAWLVEQFELAEVHVQGEIDHPGIVKVIPVPSTLARAA